MPSRCILSKFYIKPQLNYGFSDRHRVVSYRNSTSNHNYWRVISVRTSVVSYRNSTSNHNEKCRCDKAYVLYLIEILHQTTTKLSVCFPDMCCILSKFYIKPQLRLGCVQCLDVVSYRNSTSNHN